MDLRRRALQLIDKVIALLERSGTEEDTLASLREFRQRFEHRQILEPPVELIERVEALLHGLTPMQALEVQLLGEAAIRLCRQLAGFKSAKPPRRPEPPADYGLESLERPTRSDAPRASAIYVPHPPEAEPPPPQSDLVHFSITAPDKVIPGETFELLVWAHLNEQRDEMLRLAREAQGDGLTVKSKGPTKVERGAELRIALSIDKADVDPAEDTLLWAGEIANTAFLVTAHAGIAKLAGKVGVFVGPVRIALLVFTLDVNGLDQREQLHKSAFASYASADRDEVLRVIQGLEKAAPQLDIFLDVATLRAGDKWEQRLWDEIPARDVFYLFWSHNAQKSEWVEKEWRCALKARGTDFIDPVPLEGPDLAPPPKELSDRHFNDWTLAFRKKAADTKS
ncbi:MAG: toll/interleukin-1 receptor domain-containing protein [Bryobacterales bacterium]|nr:toll/interleukin-1 receptor domain-containing protein [Bryobacterales bacterium]